MTDSSGGSRISYGDANSQGVFTNILLYIIFAENFMKMKDFEPRGGWVPDAPPLESPTGEVRGSFLFLAPSDIPP